MDPLLDDLRRRWWELLSGNHSRSHDPTTLREHLRALSTVDANGTVWRIDPSSSEYEIRFTRQRRGGVVESADPATFSSAAKALTRDEAEVVVSHLSERSAETCAHWTPRERRRAVQALNGIGARRAQLRVLDQPRSQGGHTYCPIGIVESDGTITTAVDVRWAFRDGEWKIDHWPMI